MNYDEKKIEEATLALLAIFAFDGSRCWKGYSFDVMDSLHEKALISNPRSRAKSVYLTDEGLAMGQAAAARLFGVPEAGPVPATAVGKPGPKVSGA